MEKIVKINRDETSLVEVRQLMTKEGNLMGVLSMTMMQSPKTDELREGQEIEFEGRVYGVYRITSTPASEGDIINLALLDKRSIV